MKPNLLVLALIAIGTFACSEMPAAAQLFPPDNEDLRPGMIDGSGEVKAAVIAGVIVFIYQPEFTPVTVPVTAYVVTVGFWAYVAYSVGDSLYGPGTPAAGPGENPGQDAPPGAVPPL